MLLQEGKMIFQWEGNRAEVSRKDVSLKGPWCVHVCTGKRVDVTAITDGEILVQCTKK